MIFRQISHLGEHGYLLLHHVLLFASVQSDYKSGKYSVLTIVISTHGAEKEFTDPKTKLRRVEHILRVKPDKVNSSNEDDHYILLKDDLIDLFDVPEIDCKKIFLIQV